MSSLIPSTTRLVVTGDRSAFDRIFVALSATLGLRFEVELRALAEDAIWYRPSLSIESLFEFWFRDFVASSDRTTSVPEFVRASERKALSEKLGLTRDQIAGLGTDDLGRLMLTSAGFKLHQIESSVHWLAVWAAAEQAAERGEDQRIATYARQRGERLLKIVLRFFCEIGNGETFLEILKAPDKLRLPKRLEAVRDSQAPLEALSLALAENDWADLGFLTLALRKLSSRLEEKSVRHPSGKPLVILSSNESEAFSSLATALQPYAHDKPDKFATRTDDLLAAIQQMKRVTEALLARDVVPDTAVVSEVSSDSFGSTFRLLTTSGERSYRALRAPQPGQPIFYCLETLREHAQCLWCANPWPTLP